MNTNITPEEARVLVKGSELETPETVSRLTVVTQVYHENQDGPKLLSTSPYTRILDTNEESYARTVEVGEGWQPLDFGWVKNNPSFLVIFNVGPSKRSVQPTEEQRKEDREKVIEVALEPLNNPEVKKHIEDSIFSILHPRESLPIPCFNADRYRIRCKKGKTRVQVSVVPQ